MFTCCKTWYINHVEPISGRLERFSGVLLFSKKDQPLWLKKASQGTLYESGILRQPSNI